MPNGFGTSIRLAVDVGRLQERGHVVALSGEADAIGESRCSRDVLQLAEVTLVGVRCGPPTIQYVQPSTSRKVARASSASRFPFNGSSRPT